MVHEDPDELGYWMSPLSRSAAQEDIRGLFALGEAEEAQEPPCAPLLTDILPWEEQRAIFWAARHASREAFTLAEDFRNAAGYSEHIR